MFDLIISFILDLIISVFVAISPSRIYRKLVYGIPLKEKPRTFFNKTTFFIIDITLWIGVPVIAHSLMSTQV